MSDDAKKRLTEELLMMLHDAGEWHGPEIIAEATGQAWGEWLAMAAAARGAEYATNAQTVFDTHVRRERAESTKQLDEWSEANKNYLQETWGRGWGWDEVQHDR